MTSARALVATTSVQPTMPIRTVWQLSGSAARALPRVAASRPQARRVALRVLLGMTNSLGRRAGMTAGCLLP